MVLDADGNPVEKPRYGAGAVIITFLAGQLLSTVGLRRGPVLAPTTTSPSPPGSARRWARPSAQVGTGQALAIGVPPPLWLTALMQLPLWLGPRRSSPSGSP